MCKEVTTIAAEVKIEVMMRKLIGEMKLVTL
jgi:hypothetical protein